MERTLFKRLAGRQTLWLCLVLTMLAGTTTVQAADWMVRSDKFSMSSSNDHVNFKVFLCDLYGSNTYAKSGGIYAVSGSQVKWLMDLCFVEDASDAMPYGIVRTRYCISEARAWHKNGFGQVEQAITFDQADYYVQKWKNDNDYLTTDIAFYYPASMAGRTWTFYYKFTHSNGNSYTMTLGSAYLSYNLGLSQFNTADFQCERTGTDKLKFTVPALPNDVEDKYKEIHIHEGVYRVRFDFTKQDQSVVSKYDTLQCEKSNRKTYDITIPEEVGNPKRIDLYVTAVDALKDAKDYYWNDVKKYTRLEAFPTAPVPNTLTAEFRQFDKAATLSWNAYPANSTNRLECAYYIYRMDTDAEGQPLNSGTWSLRGKVENGGTGITQGYNDNNVQTGQYYKYMVLNVPKAWINNNSINSSQLSMPTETLLAQLGHAESDVLDTKPQMTIFNLQQDTSVVDKVKLTWQYSRVPTNASNVTFKVLRRTSDDVEWSEFGSATGEAEPQAGAVLTYTDNSLPNINVRYQYMIRTSVGDHTFNSAPVYAGLLSGSLVKSFTATKGVHDGTVRLSWNSKQVGTDNTAYVLSRRYVGSNDDYMRIHTTSGTAEQYTYEDNTVQPGYYYEYKVETYSSNVLQNSLTDAGFCQARGVVSGRITYGTGSSVEDVRLTLRASDSGESNTVRGYSQRFDGASTGIVWQADSAATAKVFGPDKNFTVQMFVRPDDNLADGAVLCEIPGEGRLTLGTNGLILPRDVYSLLTVSRSGDELSIQFNDQEPVKLTASKSAKLLPFSVGGAYGITDDQAFRGNITEVRVWNHKLSDKEKKSYADRILNGRETGLALYWPMDEGLDHHVFDASYANDMPNSRHATVGNNVSASTIIPGDSQLSRYALTNDNGEYIIRGIPFVGSGSSYTIVPTRGIHEFSPTSRNGFIGNGSLTLNNFDFNDTSSFPLQGTVTYLNTNIPVDSVQFKIDGQLVSSKDGAVMTDGNGEYKISVPIGKHLVEAYRDGHRLTSMPLDKSQTYDFKRAEVCNFTDSTLVNVTGRINGGFTDQDEPVGFKRSTNRLGKAIIKLSLGKEVQCSFNYIKDEHGSGSFGTENIPVASATDSIHSTAYRAGGGQDETKYIYITTDEKTAEFSAMLPPLKYKVESICFVGGDDYDNLPVFAQNLPVLDATVAVEKDMQKDSIEVDGVMKYYTYSAKMIRQYRAEPTISVVQEGMKNGAFGEVKVPVQTLAQEEESLEVLTYTDKGYSYRFGYPIFRQSERYGFEIKVAEQYKNLDTKENIVEIPHDAVVSIINDASMLTAVAAKDTIINGRQVHAGEVYQAINVQITPDETGTVNYEFCGGFPFLGEGYLRNMSIGVVVNGRTTMWKAPDSHTDALDMILLGNLPTGTNFITEGTDKVDYIIRRPPGSTSSATLEETTLDSYAKTTADLVDNYWGGGMYVSAGPTIEVEKGSVGPIVFMEKSKWQFVINHTVTRINGHKDNDYDTHKDAYTFTTKVSTPSSIPYSKKYKDFRPESGDTYIGKSTNLTFSKANMLNIYQQSDGSYKLEVKDGVSVSQLDCTQFVYSQEYIEDYLIPNWKAVINDKLIHIEGNHWDKNNPALKRVTGEVRYYTSYNPGDVEWGRANGDPLWGGLYKERGCWPAYRLVNGTGKAIVDEVEQAINQISAWEQILALNEEEKLKAFDDTSKPKENYSFGGGTTITKTSSHEHSYSHGKKNTTYRTVNNESHLGTLFNAAGAYAIVKFQYGWGSVDDKDTVNVKKTTVSYTLSDSDPRTALSVDVYQSPSGKWGPIFRTVGGQSVNPYEPETWTAYHKYYNKERTKLNEGTMRVEKPELKVKGSTELTDVPTGQEAKFTLQLTNLSETGNTCNYQLVVQENSNPNGAILTVDGMPVSTGYIGRTVRMMPNETIEKTLIVKQSDKSITDYDDIKILLWSEKDITVSSDPVTLKVHFVPSSAKVSLKVDHTVLNKEAKTLHGGIEATLYDLNRQDDGLTGVRLRYRRKGTDSWTLVKQWSTREEDWAVGYEKMPEGSEFKEKVIFTEEGLYELQAQTFGKYGNSDVTYESNIIEITQDTHGPKLLGMISPENGLLTYMNRNNMHLRFNEELNANALSKSDNFRIEGGMNNVVFGESSYPDVAAQLNSSAIETEALYDLTNSDYAFSLWFYRQGDGKIISLGTEDNLLSLSTHDGGKLSARVGSKDDVYETNAVLPKDQWMYLALSYKRKTADDSQNRISMLYATADMNKPEYIGQNMPAKDLEGHGKLSIGGNGMTGMAAELSIWNTSVSVDELYENRNKKKASYTPGLVGYWEMDEGHGTVLTDRARSRNIHMDSESWYINNENLATNVTNKPLMIDVSTFNPSKTDNYAIEMWFRGTPSLGGNPTLFSVLNGMRVIQEAGSLKLQVVERKPGAVSNVEDEEVIQEDITLTDHNYFDRQWHHFALNVRRGTSAIAYIDGQPVKVIPESSIPGISGRYLVVGGERMITDNEDGTPRLMTNFNGDVDEIRIWGAALDGQLISDRMYERMDNSYPGLVGYFPMEDIHRNQQGTVQTDFSIANFGEKDSQLKIANEGATQAVNAPALKPGSTNMRLDDTQFNFTASADEIYFSFPDAVLPLMDGNDFTAMINYIKDEHGNNSETVQWKFHADFACVDWGRQTNAVELEKAWNEVHEWKHEIYNYSGTTQTYEISGLPTWMTVDKPVGTISDYAKELTFTINSTAPVGRHTEYIYLTDRLGIRRVLQVNVSVKGDVPNWTVDPDLYESNMTMTGQIYINDKICENSDTKVAAFDELGLCRGVASPKYVTTRDAYYVDMVLYGASATELSDGTCELSFKVYNASTGTIHPLVGVTIPGKHFDMYMLYTPDVNYGSYDAPVVIDVVDNALEQKVSLAKGWTWMSVYVNPIIDELEWQLPRDKNILKRFKNIKSQFAFSTVDKNGEIEGEVTTLEPGKMYKMQLSTKTDFDLMGMALDTKNTPQIMHSGYNWIGTLSSSVMSVDEAFSDLAPEIGDRVKSRTAFAEFSNKGYWEGTLESIVPGQGYIYRSKASEEKVFHYPSGKAGTAQAREFAESNARRASTPEHYTPVDPYLYPDNLNIIAVVKKDGQERNDAEIGAFIDNECRGAIACNKGHYFLTVMGSSEDDSQKKMELRVWVDGEEYTVDNSLSFISDAAYGTLDEPYVLDIDATAIRSIAAAAAADDDADWWTLQGIKIGRKPTQPGVYIHKGQTVTIKRKR